MALADEEVLIRKCIAGNRTYQELLYQKYCRKFLGVCLRYAKNKEEAEDMLQEGFTRIFLNLKQYKGSGSLEGWMRKVIVTSILKWLRKKPMLFAEPSGSQIEEPANEEIFSDLQAGDLVDMIRQLPDGYRIVFNLYAVEGYSHREIAERLGISEGTSRSQYSKARMQLKRMITKSEMNIWTNAQ